jgi:DNA-binding NarL/FixJ family response regulator
MIFIKRLPLQKRKNNGKVMISVHITDDHAMVVELLIPVINDSGIARVTGSSLRLSECRKALALSCPDVLLLDINMTDGDGIVFCAEIHKLYPQMKIIGLTSHDEYSCVILMLKNGASGYITKSEAVSEVLEAIEAVTCGEVYICKQMEQIIRKTTKPVISLTPREKEVLQMMSKGMTNPQIAGQLRIGLSTVLSFRKKLNLKLKASNPVELVANARTEGVIE